MSTFQPLSFSFSLTHDYMYLPNTMDNSCLCTSKRDSSVHTPSPAPLRFFCAFFVYHRSIAAAKQPTLQTSSRFRQGTVSS